MEKRVPELEFVTGTNEILRILIHSKEYGNVVGITCPSMGSGIFLTAVDKVVLDYETIIQLKTHDVNGGMLERNRLKLTEITSACAFRSDFAKVFAKRPKEHAEVNVYTYSS